MKNKIFSVAALFGLVMSSYASSEVSYSNYREYHALDKDKDGTYYTKEECVFKTVTKNENNSFNIQNSLSTFMNKEVVSNDGALYTGEEVEFDENGIVRHKSFVTVRSEFVDDNTRKSTKKTVSIYKNAETGEFVSNERVQERVKKMIDGKVETVSRTVDGVDFDNGKWSVSFNYLNKEKTKYVRSYSRIEAGESEDDKSVIIESSCYGELVDKMEFEAL